MARCEDFPCCGHEAGCCPDFDESGRQLNMVCTCGAKIPVNSRYSICAGCLRDEGDFDALDRMYDDERQDDFGDGRDEDDHEFDDEPNDDMDGDHESGLASAGFGTDEDYGDYGGDGDW